MYLADKQSRIDHELLAHSRAILDQATAENDQRLNRPLTLPRRVIADINVLLARCRGPLKSPALDPEAVRISVHTFRKLFPSTLEEMMEEALADPEGYQQKIDLYEKKLAGPPMIPFETENDHYRLIVRDPLRIREEHFLFRAILHSESLDSGFFSAVDLGTGSGRLALCLADALMEFCPENTIRIYGLDLNPTNIKDAMATKISRGYGENVRFVQGDMTRTPFAQGQFSLCNASSSTYLVPFYLRPFHLLEMARILREGGEGVLTGPNEKFSPLTYARCMAATNLETYLNPVNMLVAQKLGPIGMLIEKMSKLRQDFTLPDNAGICAALQKISCIIEYAETWPAQGTSDLYSGIHFRTSGATERRMRKYNDFMEKRNKTAGVATI